MDKEELKWELLWSNILSGTEPESILTFSLVVEAPTVSGVGK